MSWTSTQVTSLEGSLDAQELHHDLARKHRNVGNKVDAIWRNFTPQLRGKAMRESTGDGQVLKHSRDRDLGDLYKYIPEYNLRDMTSNPDHFLSIFKLRALTPLPHQLYEGADGKPGDREVMEKSGLRFKQASPEEKTIFLDGKLYGQSFQPGSAAGGVFPTIPIAGAEYYIVPRAIGELILLRQGYILQFLNHLIEEILELGPSTREKKSSPDHAGDALVNAVSRLNVRPQPLKSSFPEVLAQALDAKQAFEDGLILLRTEPTVLNQAVNAMYWSRAELVPDNRGRILPVITDRHLSTAFLDTMMMSLEAIATWDYILCLLRSLDNVSEKVGRIVILQELSNACHLEYRRTQGSFKRKVAVPGHVAGKRFKRMPQEASGLSKIVMKGQPADCTISDPQLHYILRLCHRDTSPSDAVMWLKKLDEHNERHHDDRKKMSEAEVAALGDLAIIVSFMHMTSTVISMAPMSRKSGLLFTGRSSQLETTLNDLRPKVDFGDYLIPIDNLLEPQMATNALVAMESFVLAATGVQLGRLYEDIVSDSMEDLGKMCAEQRAKVVKGEEETTYVPIPKDSQSPNDTGPGNRGTKTKTRPKTQSLYAITTPSDDQPASEREPTKQLEVRATTVALFATLFSKAEARGSLSWTNFESAMADIGFSVTPKGGSVFTFYPPDTLDARSITLHRPHGSEIEGYKLLTFAQRLHRTYGWTIDSFRTA